MTTHEKDRNINPNRFNLIDKTVQRMKRDGLNSIEYKVLSITFERLFTRILVRYDRNELESKVYFK